MKSLVSREKRVNPKSNQADLVPEKKAQGQQEGIEEEASQEDQVKKKRPGSAKRHKTASLPIHETKIIQPSEQIPPDAEFKGYQDYTVQELIIRVHNIRYRLATSENANGRISEGKATRASTMLGAFWRNSQKLPSLPVSSLSCHPTQAPRTNA